MPIPPGGRFIEPAEAIRRIQERDHAEPAGSFMSDEVIIALLRKGAMVTCLTADGKLAFWPVDIATGEPYDATKHAAFDGPLFEQVTDTAYQCRYCKAIGTCSSEDMPSMYAGTETTLRCDSCGSTDAPADPFKGTRVVTDGKHGVQHRYDA